MDGKSLGLLSRVLLFVYLVPKRASWYAILRSRDRRIDIQRKNAMKNAMKNSIENAMKVLFRACVQLSIWGIVLSTGLLGSSSVHAIVLNDSLILEQWLAQVRDEKTGAKDFREALEKIGGKLAEESLKYLVSKTSEVTNPMGEKQTHRVMAEKPVLFTVLRAGFPLTYGMQRVFPDSSVGFIGSARNETTAEAESSYASIPTDTYGKVVIIGDTMLATGGSLVDSIRIILKFKPRHVIVACAIAAPEGIRKIQDTFGSMVTVISATVDSHLNERKYIIPGLGDAGDRAYGRKLTVD